MGYEPFHVSYTTNNQLQAAKKIRAVQQKLTYSLDSTGGLVHKISYPLNIAAKHIFMQGLSARSSGGQMLVSQRLSVFSTTLEYELFLKSYHQEGGPMPDEIVSDFSLPILADAVNVYTSCKTVKEYADALRLPALQKTKIEIDIAQFMKKYSNYFKDLSRRAKTFYLAVIGRLTQCTTEEEAESLIKKLFIISQSESEGVLPDGNRTMCLDAIDSLISVITGI